MRWGSVAFVLVFALGVTSGPAVAWPARSIYVPPAALQVSFAESRGHAPTKVGSDSSIPMQGHAGRAHMLSPALSGQLALRGGGAGSKLDQQVRKKKKKTASVPASSSDAEDEDLDWSAERLGSRRQDAKRFQAKARSLIEERDGPLK